MTTSETEKVMSRRRFSDKLFKLGWHLIVLGIVAWVHVSALLFILQEIQASHQLLYMAVANLFFAGVYALIISSYIQPSGEDVARAWIQDHEKELQELREAYESLMQKLQQPNEDGGS